MNLNTSGIRPTGYKVLVRPKEVEQKIGSVWIPDDHKEKQEFARQEGVLVAVSPVAFNYETFPAGTAPQEGQTVIYAKYAGFLHKGADGVEYRVINDQDIVAIIDD